jgi:hypothetical protein
MEGREEGGKKGGGEKLTSLITPGTEKLKAIT